MLHAGIECYERCMMVSGQRQKVRIRELLMAK